MPMPTSPLARLGHFRTELHACYTRRADALFELGDALLCTQAFSALPHLSLEPVCRRGWGNSTMRWSMARCVKATPQRCSRALRHQGRRRGSGETMPAAWDSEKEIEMHVRPVALGRHDERWLTRRAGWIALTLATAALLLGSILVFPRMLYPPISNHELDQSQVTGKDRIQLKSERLKLQNDARTTLLQGFGGAVVLIGVWFTYRQLHTAREGQITERFTRAVDQLGSLAVDVRIGGIYALERIARDSAIDRAATADVLAAYVRTHSPWPPHRRTSLREGLKRMQTRVRGETEPLHQVPLRARAGDVQVAMTGVQRFSG
jgi:hypothetical protein